MKRVFRVVAAMFVVVSTFTVIQGYVLNRTWVGVSVMCAVSLAAFPRAFRNGPTLYLMVYALFLFGFAAIGHSLADMKWVSMEILVPLSCLSIINVFIYTRDYDGLRIVTYVGLLIIAVMALLTLPVVSTDPTAARKMVILSNGPDLVAVEELYRKGIASFGLLHAFPFLCPILIYQVRSGAILWFRLCCAGVLVLTYIMIIKASFGTPLILSTTAIVLAFVLTGSKRQNLVVGVVVVCVFSILLREDLIISALEGANQSYFSATPIGAKIDNIVSSIKNERLEGQVSGRGDLYGMSWDAFLENPLFGSPDRSRSGGHSYFVDRLAGFGLVGMLPYFAFLFVSLKRSIAFVSPKMRAHFLLGVAMFVTLALVKNLSGTENYLYLLVFLPGICVAGDRSTIGQTNVTTRRLGMFPHRNVK